MDAVAETAKFDLSLTMVETGSGLAGSLQYSTEIVDAATIERIAKHFQTVAGSRWWRSRKQRFASGAAD